MYLLFSSYNASRLILQKLANLNLECIYIPIVELLPNNTNIDKLNQIIASYDYIILTSSEAINLVNKTISLAAKNIVFITSGKKTAESLKKYITNNILFPVKNTGSKAIVDEVLRNIPIQQKRCLIIRGTVASEELQQYFRKINYTNFTEIDVYTQKLLELQPILLKKLLGKDELQGIIITSSELARHLAESVVQNGFFELLLKQRFITIHPKIQNQLNQFNLNNVYVTKDASYDAISETIKELT